MSLSFSFLIIRSSDGCPATSLRNYIFSWCLNGASGHTSSYGQAFRNALVYIWYFYRFSTIGKKYFWYSSGTSDIPVMARRFVSIQRYCINLLHQNSHICTCFHILRFLLYTLNRTRFGLEVRAVTQNPEMASSMGINPDRINMLTFGLGSGIAGIAGIAIGLFAQVTSEIGSNYIVQSFMTVVVGGVGSVIGTLAGASIWFITKSN